MDGIDDWFEGLEAGADEYLVKPSLLRSFWRGNRPPKEVETALTVAYLG